MCKRKTTGRIVLNEGPDLESSNPPPLDSRLEAPMISESGVEMRQTHGILQALIQSSPLAIIAIDLDGRVGIWNPAAERLF